MQKMKIEDDRLPGDADEQLALARDVRRALPGEVVTRGPQHDLVLRGGTGAAPRVA